MEVFIVLYNGLLRTSHLGGNCESTSDLGHRQLGHFECALSCVIILVGYSGTYHRLDYRDSSLPRSPDSRTAMTGVSSCMAARHEHPKGNSDEYECDTSQLAARVDDTMTCRLEV